MRFVPSRLREGSETWSRSGLVAAGRAYAAARFPTPDPSRKREGRLSR